MEATISVGLMAVVFILVSQSMASIAAQRRSATARRAAQLEAENVMERLMARSFGALPVDEPVDLPASEELRRHAPQAELRVEVADDDGQPAAKRVRVEVGWPDPAGRPQNQAVLTAWKYPHPEPSAAEEAP